MREVAPTEDTHRNAILHGPGLRVRLVMRAAQWRQKDIPCAGRGRVATENRQTSHTLDSIATIGISIEINYH